MADNNKNLIQNILSIGIVQIANYLLPLIAIPIVVRIIGPQKFGIINYYTAFAAYFVVLINYGFEYTGTRFIAVNKDDIYKRNEHFTKIIVAKSLLFLISIVAFLILIPFISKSAGETHVAIYSFLITIAWVLSPNWFFQGMQDLTKVALFNFASKLLSTILILLIVRQNTYYFWPLLLSSTQILVASISLTVAIKKYRIRIIGVKFQAICTLLWESRLIFFTVLSSNLYTDTNVVILGLYESKEHVGYFTAAWKLVFVFLMIISFPLSQALFPYIAEAFAKNIDAGIEKIKRIIPAIIYFSIFSSVILYFSGHIFIYAFYGKKFGPSIPIFKILTIVPVLSFINTILGLQTMVNLKMDRAYFRIILTGGIFSVIFNLVIIRIYGYMGCAWSWIITEAIIATTGYLYLKNKGYNLFEARYFYPGFITKKVWSFLGNLR